MEVRELMKYTKEQIMELVEEEDVEFVRLQFVDILGNLKNLAITVSQLERALNNEYEFDGSSIQGYLRIEEADLFLHPDLDTFEIFPWRPQQGKVARLICDVYHIDGTPYEGDPRQVLKRTLKKASDMGYEFVVGPECEFFLFHTDDFGNPTTVTHEKAGYFDMGPIDLGENARRDMVLSLEDMGFEILESHHEIAPGQHEIDFKHDEALVSADNIMTFKLTVKSIAKRHGLHATFMPKPTSDQCGSGMHTHMQLLKDGKNFFSDESDEMGLSKEAYYFMGGIMKHMKGITLLANPLVNSYKRLVPGCEAPDYIAWSQSIRGPLIRIPRANAKDMRIELRSPDAAANPYLMLAACLSAGLEGIEKKIMPPKRVDKSLSSMSEEEKKEIGIERLPIDMHEAINEFEKDEFIKESLGKYLSKKYIELKRAEWQDYRSKVTDWEVNQYLYRV